MWSDIDKDLSRRKFNLLTATAGLSALSGGAMAQQLTEPDVNFRPIAFLVGPSGAKPGVDDSFFDDKPFFGYIYLAHDTERQFYTDDTIDYWLALPPFSPSVDIHETTVSDTTTETEIADYEIPNEQLQQDSLYKYNILGKYSTASTSDDVTLRLYLDQQLLGSVGSAGKNSTDAPWRASATITIHKHNGEGHIFSHIVSSWDEEDSDDHFDVEAIDLTTTRRLRFTAQWNNAKTGNTLTQDQGYVERWR